MVYAAAGGTGVGVLQTATDEGILSIGVDSNQNHLHPGAVLTSMMKRVDVAVYESFTAGEAVEPGIAVLGIAEGGVGWALDENNESLISADMAGRRRSRLALASSRVNCRCTTTPTTTPARSRCSDGIALN